MKRHWLIVVIMFAGMSLWCQGAENQAAAGSLRVGDAPVMEGVYPGLASDVLTYARLTELPEGMLIRCGDYTVSGKRVKEEIAQAQEGLQGELSKQSVYVLELVAARDLLLVDAKAQAVKMGTDISKSSQSEIMRDYFATVVENVKITDEEMAVFYRDNIEMFGGGKLEEVRQQLGPYLLQQKQAEVVNRHVSTLGQRLTIEVSASWVKAQSVEAMDNAVGKARQNGKPSMVDFGSKGCGPCDMMAPILDELSEEYAGKVNILFVLVGGEQVLAARYGIDSIPVQVFFDKDGKEVFRHTGFFPKDMIEKKLTEMGVK